MRKSLALLVVLIGTVAAAQSRYPVQETGRIQRSLAFSTGAAAKALEIDNINGSIRVTGYNGRTVEMNAVKTIRAASQDRVATAKQEVTLDITENSDTVRIFVDEPGRCDCRDGRSMSGANASPIGRSHQDWNSRSRRNPGYRVEFDFDVRVPRDTKLYLRTVNGGGIHVSNVAGDFDIDNINGDVELLEMSGAGRAYALNGEMKATFSTNPKSESYFGSLNGEVTVTFKRDLNANLLFKTFNGHVYTDFDLTSLPPTVEPAERRNGRLVYRRNEFSGFRVGRGGPEIRFDGFNGHIRVLGAN
ncbi:MAG: hypothetical protein HY646_00915 [Acidobacteria bacterium]|nr:hypothetical protein [Acidobacteriota bacterium]